MNFQSQPHMDQTCIACGGGSVRESWVVDKFTYGSGENEAKLSVEIPELHCEDCQMVYTDHRAETLRHNAVCKHLKIFNPQQIVEVREAAGLSQQAYAEITGIGRASLSRWENGAGFQNSSIDNLLFLTTFNENIERLSVRSVQEDESENGLPEFSARTFRCLSREQIGKLRKRSDKFHLYPVAV